MKKIFTYLSVFVLALGLTSCDGLFDSLEGDLTKMTSDDLTGSQAGLDRLMASLYSSIPMGAFSSGDQYTTDAASTDGSKGISTGGVSTFWNYTTMRDVNMFIQVIGNAKDAGTISEETYNAYLGEAYFVRAYYYFAMVSTLGGVPIVTEPLDDQFDGEENLGLYIPRSTEKETWDFVLSELDKAADLLPETRSTGKYRATKWSALGLKSRAALHAASVSKYWDQASISSSYQAVAEKLTYMEKSYANDYYQQCIAASEEIINSGKFALYGENPASLSAAIDNLTNLFLSRQDCEWIFGKSYQSGVASNSNGFDVPNSPNQAHGNNSSYWKFGCYSVTAEFVDACDYYTDSYGAADGTVKTRTNGVENTYISLPYSTGLNSIKAGDYVAYASPADAFKNKDARFQAWVIYPDASFRNTTIKIQAGLWKTDGSLSIYDDSNPSETVNGTTYYGYGAASDGSYSGYLKRGNTNDGSWYTTGFGIRKFLDPNSAPTYSQNPWYDIRYAEILLNYCEAQVEMNGTNAGNSKEYLNQIRRRAFFKDEKDATLDNVLKERRVELAFENDLPMTMFRRRSYFNIARDQASNPNGGRRHALLSVCDLRSGQPQYIFVRANYFADDTDKRASAYSTEPVAYYMSITNYTKNKLTPNPSQE